MAFTGHSRAAYPANSYIKNLPDTRRQHWLDDQQALLSTIEARAEQARVHALYCLPNDTDVLNNQLRALLSQPPCGIILLGFGSGNVPYSPALAETLQLAYEKGHMVICASQCPFGGVAVVSQVRRSPGRNIAPGDRARLGSSGQAFRASDVRLPDP